MKFNPVKEIDYINDTLYDYFQEEITQMKGM